MDAWRYGIYLLVFTFIYIYIYIYFVGNNYIQSSTVITPTLN